MAPQALRANHDALVVQRRQQHIPGAAGLTEHEVVGHKHVLIVDRARPDCPHPEFRKQRVGDAFRLGRNDLGDSGDGGGNQLSVVSGFALVDLRTDPSFRPTIDATGTTLNGNAYAGQLIQGPTALAPDYSIVADGSIQFEELYHDLRVEARGRAPGVVHHVQVPATYWVEMISDGNEWRPAEHIPMPHHHATRLELVNLADFPALAARQGERLRFTVEIASREIHQVSGRREWRATYHARIVAVCIPT